MEITYNATGYDIYRNSKSKIYTHAVIFRNVGDSNDNYGATIYGATFHTSLKTAQAGSRDIARRSHLEFIEIVPVTKEIN